MFLTGQEEIESVERLIRDRIRQLPEGNQKLLTFPIFSSLPSEKQLKVFMPASAGFRKVCIFMLLVFFIAIVLELIASSFIYVYT